MINKNGGSVELSIIELRQRWIMLRYKHGINKLKITECFDGQKNRSFIVENINMVFDVDNLVCCYDKHNTLLNNCSVLSLFLQHQLTKIKVIPFVEERLEFGEDGYVIIKK